MGKKGLFSNNNLPFMYLEEDGGTSVAAGIDINASNEFKINVLTTADITPFSGAQFTISPSANGDVTVDPNGTGSLVLASGNFKIPDTTSGGANGVIYIGINPWIHNAVGINNTYVGELAGSLTSAATNNTGIGSRTLQITGAGASNNAALGAQALQVCNNGINNTACGARSAEKLTDGNYNTAIGAFSAQNLTTGTNNIALGSGINAGFPADGPLGQLTTGTYNIGIGNSAGLNYTGAESSNICLGSATQGTVGESNTMRLGTTGAGNGQVNRCFIAGTHSITPAGASISPMLIDSSGQVGSEAQLAVARGGTGAASLTDGGFLLGSGTGAVTVTAQPTNGQLPIGSTGADPVLNTLTAGTGISISNGAGSITVNSSGGGLSWSVITTATQALANDNGYIANRGAGVAFTLPAAATVGQIIRVTTIDAGGWTIAQNAGQSIRFGSSATTIGVGGSLASTANGDTVEMVCTVANTSWIVLSSVGNITIV